MDLSSGVSHEALKHELYLAVTQTADMVMITDADRAIIYVNPAFEQVTGFSAAECIGKTPVILKSHRHGPDFYQLVRATLNNGEAFSDVFINRRKNGELFYEQKTITPLKDAGGKIIRYVSTGKDISDRVRAQEHFHHLINHDPLTDLPNRSWMTEHLKRAIAQAQWHRRGVALLLLDLDGFKVINDTLGHDSGDQMICEMARRLSNAVRTGEMVARLGGDEFGILIADIAAAEDVQPFADRLLTLVAQPMPVEGQQLFVTASIGICCYPHHGDDAKSLLRNADIAMYRAKSNGRNQFQYFSADMTAKAFERLRLEGNLREALARDQYRLHYQPQVDIGSGRVTGLEALLRWSSPDLGIVSPDQFIPVLEDTGLIVAVGQWVIRAACKELRRLLDAGLNVPSMSINLSARQLFDTQLIAVISASLAEYGIDPGRITMEITESILMENHQSSGALLRELREMGIHIALDDFGTGFSSLGYLRRFPIDIVKIDRSFIGDLPHRKEGSSIVSAIISMAHDLEIEVIAEGVENREQLDFLRARRCDGFQGFLFSKPVCGEPLEAALSASQYRGVFIDTHGKIVSHR